MAWYKLHFPLEYFAVMLETQRKNGFDVKYMAYGKDRLDDFAEFLRSSYAAETPFVMDARRTCALLHDFYDKGFIFKISEGKSDTAETFRIVNDHTIEVDATKCRRSSDYYDENEMYIF